MPFRSLKTHSVRAENCLAEASTRKQKARYKYDALGRRVRRYTPGVREDTKFTNDGLDVLVDNDAGTLTKYLNGPGIDNKLRVQTGSSVNYFLTDHLGSTNGLAAPSGALVASTTYDSFGNSTITNFPSRYRFTGREVDSFSGLQFSRARFYDPTLGRFISEDPIGFRGGDVNLFGYVQNRPLMRRDSIGLFPDGAVLNADTVRSLGPVATVLSALAAPEIAVAATGVGAIYGASLIGDYTANHPSNPFVNGPWNPFGNPHPSVRPLPPTITSPTSQPYCKPVPRAIPFYNWPPEYPIPLGPYPPWTPEKHDDCVQKCSHLLGIPGDYGNKYRACYRRCMGTID